MNYDNNFLQKYKTRLHITNPCRKHHLALPQSEPLSTPKFIFISKMNFSFEIAGLIIDALTGIHKAA